MTYIFPEDTLSPKDYIIIKGARVNNLKNINLAIPRKKFIVITGVSGSGKSSLAFDTIFAEGHRLYVESLNSYARQFLGKISKPELEYIKGLSPAIALEQKTNSKNPRSTVGTTTEIYDYLRVLFSRIGETFSPISNEKVMKHTVRDVLNHINSNENSAKYIIAFPVKNDKNIYKKLKSELAKGFTRIVFEENIIEIQSLLNEKNSSINFKNSKYIDILVDRIIVKREDEDTNSRIIDSVQTAFFEGEGYCIIKEYNSKIRKVFSDKFELDKIIFEEPSSTFFNFNTPYGACEECNGIGNIYGIDEKKVIPNANLSISEGAILPWQTPSMSKWLFPLLKNSEKYKFPITLPYNELNKKYKKILWNGFEEFMGINSFFEYLKSNYKKLQYRILLSKFKGITVCPECYGSRLRKDTEYVKINKTSIVDLVMRPINKLLPFFQNLDLNDFQKKAVLRVIKEITDRIEYLNKVGLGYLTLNRSTATLSGGEFQRARLATALGSSLIGTMYILDEPTIGLHPRDTFRLTSMLSKLKDHGNTVIVVEHDEEVMKFADQLIDIGPEAGTRGGEVMFQGTLKELKQKNNTITAKYFNKILKIPIPHNRRSYNKSILIKGANENNIKNLDIEVPLGILTVITGVSGSGKSTLVKKILYPAIAEALFINVPEKGQYEKITGDYKFIDELEFIDQNPLVKTSRSNPITYTKAYDNIRSIFANLPLSIERNYDPGKFSFNVEGGRCDTCFGEGVIKIEMQFMADIRLSCETCNGKRFKEEILEVKYKNKNINDILKTTIDDAVDFFKEYPELTDKLKPLQEVGLGYICLGQSTSILSGGEAQRLKLASFMKEKHNEKHRFFIFDEPTTGLHFSDIQKLLNSINRLIEMGNSVVIIEHNLDIIKSADWIIDMGPDGGDKGGEIVFKGIPEEMIKLEDNITAKYLKQKFIDEDAI